MKKNIGIAFILFVVGLYFSIRTETGIRYFIQEIYLWSTHDQMHLLGKNFFLFNDLSYYLSIALAFVLFGLSSRERSSHSILKHTIYFVLLSIGCLISLSAMDANLKLLLCTNCENGMARIRYHEINYGFLMRMSLLVGLIPSCLTLLRHWNGKQNFPYL